VAGHSPLFTSRRLIWLAGFALIAAGIVCLYLSDAVAHPGSWWQGTLDAFGVGLVVGGVVDVLAISGLNQALSRQQSQRDANREAETLLGPQAFDRETADAAIDLIRRSGTLLDPYLRTRLDRRIRRYAEMEARMRRPVAEQPQQPQQPQNRRSGGHAPLARAWRALTSPGRDNRKTTG